MLYTNQSIRFTASEIAAYRNEGIDLEGVSTYRQFIQITRQRKAQAGAAQRVSRQAKEKDVMAKRYGRRALNGTTEFYDSYEELREAQRSECAKVRSVLFGLLGLLAGGVLAYQLLHWMHVDSRIARFVTVIFAAWFCGVLAVALSAQIWMLLKWVLRLTLIGALCGLVFLLV